MKFILQKEPFLTEHCTNRLGYWYFINYIEVMLLKIDFANHIGLMMENRGFGLCYYDYTLRITLRSSDGAVFSQDFAAGNRNWRPGKESFVSLPFTPRDLPIGEYGLYIGLFEGTTPIELGLKAKRKDGGMYHLCNIPVIE